MKMHMRWMAKMMYNINAWRVDDKMAWERLYL